MSDVTLPSSLPDHWQSVEMKWLLRFGNGSDYKDVEDDGGEFPVYGSGGEFARASDYLYDGESVLFGRKGTIDRPLYVSGRFWTVDTMYFTRLGPRIEGRFLYYFATTIPYGLLSTSTALPSMTQATLGAVRVPLPPFGEQRAIADFLDRETAQIDAMVDAQERLVALLEERQRSVLLHAVTGRSDATETTTASGLRWAGNIPTHWEVGNIRRFADMRTGHTPSRQQPEYWEDCTIPWFTLADVWQLRAGRTHVAETSQMISELGLANSAAELLPAGTVMLSRTASVGFSGIMSVPMATSQDYWNWVCGPRLMPEYLLYTFRAMFDELRSLTAGSTHKTIYEANAASLRIPVPPINEQQSIVRYLEEQLGRMNGMIAKAQESVALMKERRAALISAAVTGRIDVRTGVELVERNLQEVGA